MAVLYVSEHLSAVSVIGTTAPAVLPQPALTIQTVAIGAGSTQSSAFGSRTSAIEIVSDIDCHFSVGPNPTASATTMYLPAKTPRIYGVANGDKIAVIT